MTIAVYRERAALQGRVCVSLALCDVAWAGCAYMITRKRKKKTVKPSALRIFIGSLYVVLLMKLRRIYCLLLIVVADARVY